MGFPSFVEETLRFCERFEAFLLTETFDPVRGKLLPELLRLMFCAMGLVASAWTFVVD